MEDLIPAYLAVKQIISERKPYAYTIFKVLQTEKVAPSSAKRIRVVVYGVLNNYNKLCFESLNIFDEYKKDSDESFLNIVTIYEIRTFPEDEEEILTSYINSFEALRLLGDAKTNSNKIKEALKTPFKIPDEVKELPFSYNALTLEMPEFLLKIMFKELGGDKAIELSLALHKKPFNFYQANLYKTNSDFLINDKRFESTKLVDGTILYKYLSTDHTPKEVKEALLYRLDYSLAFPYSIIELPQVSPKILMAASNHPDTGAFFAMKTKDLFESEIISCFANPLVYRLAVDEKNKNNLTSLTPVLTPVNLIKTYYDYDSFDLVCYEGDDSGIGLSRRHPGALPSLTLKRMQSSFKKQVNDLLEASEFVKNNGYLLLTNNAITDLEGADVTAEFLKMKKNFSLVKEAYIYPMEMNSDSGYYAILRRKE